MTRVEPSFSVKDYGASKLVDLVRAQDYLEVEQPDGGSVRVRLRAGRKTAARSTTKKTATKKTTARSATKKAAQAVPAPEPEPAPVPVKHTVTTRKRSERKR